MMKMLLALLLVPQIVLAQQDAATAPANATVQPARNPYAELNRQVQQKLQQRGFYSGPVNGVVGPNTQAAIAQFQLSLPMPASGMLDDTTLAALGVEPPAPASAGQSAQTTAETAGETAAQERKLGGSCDALAGPEKEACLKQGGTVEASAPASTGASVPATSKEN